MTLKDSYIHGNDQLGVVKSIELATTAGTDSLNQTYRAYDLLYTLADTLGSKRSASLPILSANFGVGVLYTVDAASKPIVKITNTAPVYYVKGPSTDTTAGTWTGTIAGLTASDIVDGTTIIYIPAVAGINTGTTLNINGTGAKTCYYNNTSKLTTHYSVGTPILLTYYNNCWRRADYDSNSNTWRDIYLSGTLKLGTGTNTKGLNYVAGSNVTIEFAAAGTSSGQSGNANYNSLKISVSGTTTAPSASSDDTTVPTSKAVWSAISNGLAASDAMIFKGVIAGAANSTNGGTLTPAANAGWTYKVSTAGYINGQYYEVGDTLICGKDNTVAATSTNYTTVRSDWFAVLTNGTWSSYLAKTGGTMTGNITVGTNNTYDLGASDKKWKTVYATTFSGNASSASKVNNSLIIKWGTGTTEDTDLFTYDGSAAKTVVLSAAAIGASASDHTHTVKINNTTKTIAAPGGTAVDLGSYLPLSGGTITSSAFGPLVIERSDDTYGASILFRGNSNIYGYIGFNAAQKDGNLLRWNSSANASYKILDESNLGYTTSGENRAVQIDSSGKLYVAQATYSNTYLILADASHAATEITTSTRSGTFYILGTFDGTKDALVTAKAINTQIETRIADITKNLVIKWGAGNTEGTNLFTYNGTVAKTIDLSAVFTKLENTATTKTLAIINALTTQEAKDAILESGLYSYQLTASIGGTTKNVEIQWAKYSGRSNCMYGGSTASNDTRGHWTVDIPEITSLYDGLTIHVRLNTYYYGSNEGYNTLNVSGLGAKLVWYSYNNRLTSHYGLYTELILTYRTSAGSYTVSTTNGELTKDTTYKDGWVIHSQYYSNDYNTYTEYAGETTGNNGLKALSVLLRTSNDRWDSVVTTSETATTKTVNTAGFIVGSKVWYTGYNVAANTALHSSWRSIYSFYRRIDFRYSSNCGTTLTAGKPVYLVGTVKSDGYFYLDTTTWWTQTIPTSANGKVYVRIGGAYNTYLVDLYEVTEWYEFSNGCWHLYNLLALRAKDLEDNSYGLWYLNGANNSLVTTPSTPTKPASGTSSYTTYLKAVASWSSADSAPTYTYSWVGASTLLTEGNIGINFTETLTINSWKTAATVSNYTSGLYVLMIKYGTTQYASGVFSIYKGTDTIIDEIPLHNAGSAGFRIYARINGTSLLITTNETTGTSRTYNIYFKRLI